MAEAPGMVGRVYFDPGRRGRRRCPGRDGGLVRVVVRWSGRGRRNVLVQPLDGRPAYVRPFRGLRRSAQRQLPREAVA